METLQFRGSPRVSFLVSRFTGSETVAGRFFQQVDGTKWN